jgi:endonuclease G, mitochondrial
VRRVRIATLRWRRRSNGRRERRAGMKRAGSRYTRCLSIFSILSRMRIVFTSAFASLLLAVASQCFAGDACTGFSPNGRPPVLTNTRMAVRTQSLCYSDFAVLHSGVTHGPLWSAEHLTRAHVLLAEDGVRTNRFYEEPALPDGEGARLADFRRSGYDRGHMSPAGDRWNAQAMAESFSLANMVPQNPVNNRKLWARIEQSVRHLALQSGEAYVVTGPMFAGSEIRTIGERGVFVPTQLFKVVYLPSRAVAFAVVADNTATARYSVVTVHELERSSGISFPGIPEGLKNQRTGDLDGI